MCESEQGGNEIADSTKAGNVSINRATTLRGVMRDTDFHETCYERNISEALLVQHIPKTFN
jgi:hypothetical protein